MVIKSIVLYIAITTMKDQFIHQPLLEDSKAYKKKQLPPYDYMNELH